MITRIIKVIANRKYNELWDIGEVMIMIVLASTIILWLGKDSLCK